MPEGGRLQRNARRGNAAFRGVERSDDFGRDAFELPVNVDVVDIDGADQVPGANQVMTVVSLKIGEIEHAELPCRDEQADRLVVFEVCREGVLLRIGFAE